MAWETASFVFHILVVQPEAIKSNSGLISKHMYREIEEATAEKTLVKQYFQGISRGVFIEVGANEPRDGSQTWELECLGWTGILVEPLSQFYGRLVEQRPRSKVFRCACGPPEKTGTTTLFVPEQPGFATTARNQDDFGIQYLREETVPVETLDQLIQKAGFQDSKIHFVSIDVEGTELEVLQGFDLARYAPELILLEDKLTGMAKHRYLVSRGYKLVKRTCLNNWYIPRDRSFGLTTSREKLRLWRKVYLGMPIRHWQYMRRKRAANRGKS
jgi:FkbM family methyltransferase